jgi:hypothetical protein
MHGESLDDEISQFILVICHPPLFILQLKTGSQRTYHVALDVFDLMKVGSLDVVEECIEPGC